MAAIRSRSTNQAATIAGLSCVTPAAGAMPQGVRR